MVSIVCSLPDLSRDLSFYQPLRLDTEGTNENVTRQLPEIVSLGHIQSLDESNKRRLYAPKPQVTSKNLLRLQACDRTTANLNQLYVVIQHDKGKIDKQHSSGLSYSIDYYNLLWSTELCTSGHLTNIYSQEQLRIALTQAICCLRNIAIVSSLFTYCLPWKMTTECEKAPIQQKGQEISFWDAGNGKAIKPQAIADRLVQLYDHDS